MRTTTPIKSRKSSVQKPGFPDGFLGADEELRALRQVEEMLESVGALLDGRLQSTANRDVREALGRYRENLVHLRSELAVMEASAIGCRVRLDSRRKHLYAAKAWCAASRAIS